MNAYALALASLLSCSVLLACTAHPAAQGVASDPAGTAPADDADDVGSEDAPARGDAGARPDARPPSPPPVPLPPPPDVDPVDAGPTPTLVAGSITLTCPQSGFHAGPPVRIASLATANLPRCSAATKTCAYAAATSAAYDACLAADTTPPAIVGGEPVDCTACDRTQGSYCLASACTSQFATYACCAQARGDAACTAERAAITTCARTTGKPAFESCVGALVGACFAK